MCVLGKVQFFQLYKFYNRNSIIMPHKLSKGVPFLTHPFLNTQTIFKINLILTKKSMNLYY